MKFPYSHDPLKLQQGAIVRTTPDPARPDKVMDLGRVIEGCSTCATHVAWLTTRRHCEPFHSYAAPGELMVLTHEVAQVVLAQLDRERNHDTAYLWTVSFAAEVWLDRMATGEDLDAADLNARVELLHARVINGYDEFIRERYLFARERSARAEYQRMQADYQACVKRMRTGVDHVQH